MHQDWIHDMFQPVFEGDEPHGEKAAIWTKNNLEQWGFPKNKISDVASAVKVHSTKPGLINKNKIEACILWDADKLSKLSPYNFNKSAISFYKKNGFSIENGKFMTYKSKNLLKIVFNIEDNKSSE